jgi:hypothetical protein
MVYEPSGVNAIIPSRSVTTVTAQARVYESLASTWQSAGSRRKGHARNARTLNSKVGGASSFSPSGCIVRGLPLYTQHTHADIHLR